MIVEITPRRDARKNWEALNPVLRNREMGLEISDGTFSMKVGDGRARWLELPYLAEGMPLPGGQAPVIIAGLPPTVIATGEDA
jgi:hypothetical protein